MNDQDKLDAMKLARAKRVVAEFSMPEIRAKSLANLNRWKTQGVWCSAYGEWAELMKNGSDSVVLDAMIGESENSNRLRQSAPYVGLLDRNDCRKFS